MKSKLSTKILGIVVTVATLSSLLVGLTAAPVSAAPGAMGYGSVSTPGNGNLVLGGVTYTASPPSAAGGGFTQAGAPTINFLEATADGTTMFAYDTAASMLYTSTNQGASWTPRPWTGTDLTATGLNLLGAANAPIRLLVSPNFATDNTIVLVTPSNVYISSNGGGSFSAAPAPNLEGGIITSADIGVAYNDGTTPSVLIGISAGAAGSDVVSNVQKFKLSGSYAWSQIGGLTLAGIGNYSVFGVAYSKTNALDAEIIAVIGSALDNVASQLRLVSSFTGGNFDLANAKLLVNSASVAVLSVGVAPPTTRALIVMGSDYNGFAGGNTLVIGLKGSSSDDVYRITGRSSGAPGSVLDCDLGGAASTTVINDIAINGTMATGTVLVGTAANSRVYSNATFPTGTTVSFSGGSKAPAGVAGTNAVSGVTWGGTTAFAAVTGADGGVSSSTNNGANWNGLSLINVGTLGLVTITSFNALDNNNLFCVLTNTTGGLYSTAQLWTSANGGSSWMRTIASVQLSGGVAATIAAYPSPAYATDKSYWVSQGAVSSPIYTTTDNGTTFTPMVATANQTVIKSINGTTFYYGGTANGSFYKFGRWSNASFPAGIATTVASIAFNPTDTTNATIAVGMADGSVYLSTNDGVSFTQVGSSTPGTVVAYGPDGSLYVIGATTIYRWVASSSSFLPLQTTSATNGLVVTKDGTLYASDSLPANGVWRSLYPTTGSATSTILAGGIKANEWQTINSAAFTSDASAWAFGGGTIVNPLSVVNTATDNTVYVVAINAAGGPAWATGTSGIANMVKGFKDNFILAAAQTAPANGAVLTTKTSAALSWPAYTNSTNYQFAVNDAAAFTGNDFSGVDVTLASNNAANITTSNLTANDKGNTTNQIASGSTYSWRVRAIGVTNGGTAGAINSRWSTGASFTTAMITPADLNPVQAMTPVQGATGVDVNSTFSWPAVPGATYEFVIAEELGNADKFAIIDYSATSPTNATPLRETLKYNTQYWWRVRSVNGTSTSAWTVGFFTTGSAPVTTTAATTTQAPPVQTIIVPTQTIPTPTVTVINSGNQNNTPVIPSALLWAIIAIGAVLIIAVIVLIVRTRKI